MNLSTQAIHSFQKVYQESTGIELSNEEADYFGWKLLNLFKLTYRPIPKKDAWITEPIVPVYEIK